MPRPGSAPHSTVWTVLLALLGVGLLWIATEGARAFTSEGARRLEIERAPRPVPRASLEDASGEVVESDTLVGGTLVVGFVYTQCGSVCPDLSREFRELQDALERRPDLAPVRLLSVSFDPDRDTPERLAEYGRHFGADPGRWRLARIRDPEQLERWLETFGVVVISDGRGGYAHNAALHLVDPDGEFVAVHDLGDIEGVIERVAASAPPGDSS